MRQRFEQQMNLRTVAIADVKFPLKSRDELPPVLMALQYIFVTPELNEKVFAVAGEKDMRWQKENRQKGHVPVAYPGSGRGAPRLQNQLGHP
ncbi:MAG: hypothetical protein WKG06_40740 [Segetibacter sp.]